MEQFHSHQLSWPRIVSNTPILFRKDGKSTEHQCGSDLRGNYDTLAHIFAIVLIFVLSVSACGIPLLTRRSSKSGQGKLIFLSQHFGTGVLIATAFVHLLPTAFISLTDPCLSPFFSKYYPSLPGLVAMISLFIVVGIEMFVMTNGAKHSHSHAQEDTSGSIQGKEQNMHVNSGAPREDLKKNLVMKDFPATTDNCAPDKLNASSRLLSDSFLLLSAADASAQNVNNRSSLLKGEIEDDLEEICHHEIPLEDKISDNLFIESHHCAESLPEAQRKRMMIQCLMLEAAILFHSIFIGMAVSVATGPPFVVFLIAIGFHQVFEGLALGSRIAAIQFPSRSLRPWFMVLAYGVTTPIGQAIGLVLHNMYDPQSAAGLLMVGFMNAVSSGLLIYAGLVQLLAEDLLSDKSFETLKGRRRIEAFCSVLIGALLMALVGAWA